jgi:hypothetical protein
VNRPRLERADVVASIVAASALAAFDPRARDR